MVHTPASEPGGTSHSMPVQQSALVVHKPPFGTQEVPHTNWPVTGSGTQGNPSQHWAENEQLPPGGMQVSCALQRGIPTVSSWQHPLSLTQSQQLLFTLVRSPPHAGVGLKWQILPSGMHVFLQVAIPSGQLPALGLPQVPIREP